MFFHRCSIKKSSLNELEYNSRVLVLMICSLKEVIKDLALDFVFFFEGLVLVYIAYPLRFTTIS